MGCWVLPTLIELLWLIRVLGLIRLYLQRGLISLMGPLKPLGLMGLLKLILLRGLIGL